MAALAGTALAASLVACAAPLPPEPESASTPTPTASTRAPTPAVGLNAWLGQTLCRDCAACKPELVTKVMPAPRRSSTANDQAGLERGVEKRTCDACAPK